MKELIRVRVKYASRQQCCKTYKRPLHFTVLHLKYSSKRVNYALNVYKLPSSARKETQEVLHAMGSTIGSTSPEHFVFSEFRIFRTA